MVPNSSHLAKRGAYVIYERPSLWPSETFNFEKNEKMVRKNNNMCLGHNIRLGFMTPTEGVIIQVETCPYKLVDDSSPFKLTKLI